MAEINAVCMPMVVYLENVCDNPGSAQQKREKLQKASQEPVSCLLGSITELSNRISSLPLLPNAGCADTQAPKDKKSTQLSIPKQAGQPTSTFQDKQESLSWSGHSGFQQESPPPPQPGQGRSNTSSEKHEGGMPKLVELYQFPGFSKDGAMPLPYHTPFSTVVTQVVRAQQGLSHKPRYKAAFQSNLSSVLMEHFVTDMFWWLFLQNFQPDGQVQDCLFSRIAENYIRILTHNQSSRISNVFLREFPCILSQTLYSCFCCCFPQSCSTIRHGTFLQMLCSTAYQWTEGVCPAPNVFKKWDFKALEPEEAGSRKFTAENEKKEPELSVSLLDSLFPGAGVSSQRDGPPRKPSPVIEPSKTSSKGAFSNTEEQNINNPSEKEEKSAGSEDIKGSDQKAATDHSNRKSTKECDWYKLEFGRCTFDLWGNSPLVQHFMHKFRPEPSVGQGVLVRRTQIRTLPPGDTVTYRQLIRQCRERSAARWHDLKAARAQCAEELAALHRIKAEQRHILLKKQTTILSQQSSVKRYYQKLYPDTTKEEEIDPTSESS
ncbi:protein FAM227A-like isoform X2 [Alosa alosa]|uniref:protein FAM227A-like isoform X2 n=1 Tax=Alosa alosa TaxID=278164 RepID=UPI002015061B|nr:protein FAM227A-like isoform X2 [Alosa alosa]